MSTHPFPASDLSLPWASQLQATAVQRADALMDNIQVLHVFDERQLISALDQLGQRLLAAVS